MKDSLLKRIFGSLAAALFALAAAGCVGPPVDDDGPVDDGDDVEDVEDGEDGEDGGDVIVIVIEDGDDGDDGGDILIDLEDPEFDGEEPV